jgi:tetratricopeptide (TPR) repeat protein
VTIQLGSASSASNSEAAVSVNSLTVPSKAREAFEAADRLFQKNDVTGAWKKIEKALQSSPKYAAALTLRGLLKMSTNQPQQALPDFIAALEADRGYQVAYAALAADYNLMGQFDEALRVLDQGNSLSMQSWQAHFEASKALLGKKNFDRALKEANQAASLLGRDFPLINVVKAHAYMGLQDTNSAASELREYLRRENNGPLADKVRGILANLGK